MLRYSAMFVCVISSIWVVTLTSTFEISEFYFYCLCILLLLNAYETRTVTLYQVWILSFIYIILSEGLIARQLDILLAPTAIRFLIHANNVLLFGYYVMGKAEGNVYLTRKVLVAKAETKYAIFLLVAIFTLYQFPRNIVVFTSGRTSVSMIEVSILSNVFNSLGFFLPALVAFYIKNCSTSRSFLVAILVAAPVFITLFIGGTRFPLLFAFAGFVFVWFDVARMSLVRVFKIVCIMLILIYSASVMRGFRAFGFGAKQSRYELSDAVKTDESLVAMAAEMSPEGVLDMTNLMMNYFKDNAHTYGASTGFILYFWIPRFIWPDKPSMLGHWLVREYRSGFSKGYSASFGFTGELYADFGYFSFLFVFVLGMLLRKLEWLKQRYFQARGYEQVLGAMFFPYVFFFVRSPVTATMTFISIMFFYWFTKSVLFDERVLARRSVPTGGQA